MYSQEQVNAICRNIGMALSVIYSNRVNADVKITCMPVKISEMKGENDDRIERVS